MVSTNNRNFYNIALSIRAHGWSRDVEKKFKIKLEKKYKVDEFTSLFTFYYTGFNIRSTDFNANIGIEQLKKIKKIAIKRNQNFNRYKKNLKDFWKQSSDLKINSVFINKV